MDWGVGLTLYLAYKAQIPLLWDNPKEIEEREFGPEKYFSEIVSLLRKKWISKTRMIY